MAAVCQLDCAALGGLLDVVVYVDVVGFVDAYSDGPK